MISIVAATLFSLTMPLTVSMAASLSPTVNVLSSTAQIDITTGGGEITIPGIVGDGIFLTWNNSMSIPVNFSAGAVPALPTGNIPSYVVNTVKAHGGSIGRFTGGRMNIPLQSGSKQNLLLFIPGHRVREINGITDIPGLYTMPIGLASTTWTVGDPTFESTQTEAWLYNSTTLQGTSYTKSSGTLEELSVSLYVQKQWTWWWMTGWSNVAGPWTNGCFNCASYTYSPPITYIAGSNSGWYRVEADWYGQDYSGGTGSDTDYSNNVWLQ